MQLNNSYNPDVLTCLANLSNDEVFTPPTVVNQMLDMLPAELFRSPKTRFLDPVSKSGVFLREIAKRLMIGLEQEFPNVRDRANHIFTHQLFGIGITELTSLISRRSVYCSKSANGRYSLCTEFKDAEGNIRFRPIEHTFQNSKCKFCGASEDVFGKRARGTLESHAYEFIHTDNPQKLFPKDMFFDVIIGNPPYQLSDGGNGVSAKPIYQLFIQQAKKLNPRYLVMIVPSRWFIGGKGLDTFRTEMLADKRIRKIVDFENTYEVFPGVDIAGGINYFLWGRDNPGMCEFVNMKDNISISRSRYLNEFDVLIRQNQAVDIVKKVRKIHGENGVYMSQTVSPSKPFGLRTFYEPKESGIPCWFIQKIGRKFASEVDYTDDLQIKDKWKFLVPRSPIAGQTDFTKPVGFYYDGNVRIAEPGEVCTESYIVLFSADTKEEVLSFKSYLFTKAVRFLLLQSVASQDVTRNCYRFVPSLGRYDGVYTDELLRERWNITDDEWKYIDSRIKGVDEMNVKN